ncbi:unnamed protein product, partial [Staurois parvus]
MYIHRNTHAQTHVNTYTCTYIQTHVHTRTCTDTCTHTPYKKLQFFIVHSQSRVLHSRGGREHSTHSLLCFHYAQLLSSPTAPSANNRSSLSSEPAQQDGPGGHICPHHNFHLPLASRRVENSRPVL